MAPDTSWREWLSAFIYITLLVVKLLICVRNVPTCMAYARTVYGPRWAAAARGPFSAEAHMSPPLAGAYSHRAMYVHPGQVICAPSIAYPGTRLGDHSVYITVQLHASAE